MTWLNYHHLLYFWVVAREGSIARACRELDLAQPTISGQLRELEKALGEKLFERAGRGLALTEAGRLVYSYAGQIFHLGQELHQAVRGLSSSHPAKLVVGVADVLPKLIVHRLLQPLKSLSGGIRLVVREGKPARLLADLELRELDVLLLDTPVRSQVQAGAYNHPLGQSGLSFFATAALAETLPGKFPARLRGAPVLLPTEDTALRRVLDRWLHARRLTVQVRGEFDDSALLKVFGQQGEGVFAMPSIIEKEVCRVYGVRVVGRARAVVSRWFAITPQRRVTNPAVAALIANPLNAGEEVSS